MPLHGAGHMAQGQDDEGEENEWSGSYRLATYGRYSYCSYQICGERFPLSVKARTTALSMPVDALPLMQLPSNPLFSFFVLFVLFVFLVAWCLARAPLPVTGVQETLLTKTSSGFPPQVCFRPDPLFSASGLHGCRFSTANLAHLCAHADLQAECRCSPARWLSLSVTCEHRLWHCDCGRAGPNDSLIIVSRVGETGSLRSGQNACASWPG